MAPAGPRLPPLNTLRAFRAVLRQGSFRAAAEDLRVSPQAISQQVKLLEETLNVALFNRTGRVVEPTEQAIILSHFVEAGFTEFEEGIRRVAQTGHPQRLNLNVSPYFATRYLMQRLDRFRHVLPGIDLRMTTRVDTPDFTRDEVDASIQWGFADWSGYEVTLLIRDPKVICCTAKIAQRIRSPEALLSESLLTTASVPPLWPSVLRHLGVQDSPAGETLAFGDADTMQRATLAGLGVGLVSRVDALVDIAAGRLAAPLGTEALATLPKKEQPGFYLIVPKANLRVPPISALCRWIRQEDWARAPEIRPEH